MRGGWPRAEVGVTKLALACASLIVVRAVGTLAVRAIVGAIDLAIWLMDGDQR